jgi:hypothetical protein
MVATGVDADWSTAVAGAAVAARASQIPAMLTVSAVRTLLGLREVVVVR